MTTLSIDERNTINYWDEMTSYKEMGSWIAEPATMIRDFFRRLFESPKVYGGKYHMKTTEKDEQILIGFEYWLEHNRTKPNKHFTFYHCLDLHEVILDRRGLSDLKEYLERKAPYVGSERTWNMVHLDWMHDHGLTLW